MSDPQVMVDILELKILPGAMKDYRIKTSVYVYIVNMSLFSIQVLCVYTAIPSKPNSQCRKYYQIPKVF